MIDRIDWVTTYPFNILWKEGRHIVGHPRSKGDVVIGNDVWIGMDALILSGVHIGDGAVIGAQAVVSKDVSPYGVAVGNPAQVVKQRFDEQTVAELLEIKWWQWDEKQVAAALPALANDDIDGFIAYVRQLKTGGGSS